MSLSIQGTINRCCTPANSGCILRLAGTCVYYTGASLPGPGITNGNLFDTVIVKIIDYIDAQSITASNGLSVSSGAVVLGQNVGQSGNPAALTSNREIPMAGFSLSLLSGSITQTQSVTGTSTTSALSISPTWNTSGSPSAFFMNVTNTASGASARLVNIQQDASDRFVVEKAAGILTVKSFGIEVRSTGGAAGGISLSASPAGPENIISATMLAFTLSNPSTVTNYSFSGGAGAPTSGNYNIILANYATGFEFTPASGTATATGISLEPLINQTGSASGVTRGMHINPTLTSAVDFRAVEVSNTTGKGVWQTGSGVTNHFNGVAGFGVTSLNASAKVQIDSTTQGFLPPRMTTGQRDAIASPAAGLMIYNTTTNKLNVFTTGWEVITSA